MNFWWAIFYFQNRDGNLANGAIANLVDIVGSSVVYVNGLSMNVSVEMSISYLSTAKLNVSNPSTEIPPYVLFYIYVIHNMMNVSYTWMQDRIEFLLG